jgi:small ligand-binding sensory domain FIST
MLAALGLSHFTELERGLAAAAADAREGLAGEPELAIAFISTAHGTLDGALKRRVSGLAGASRGAAAQVEGFRGASGDCLATPAVAVLACRGLGRSVYLFDQGPGREEELGEELMSEFGPFGERDLLVILSDAHALDARRLTEGLAACRPAVALGLGVAGSSGAGAVSIVDEDAARGGALAICLRAPASLRRAVAPGTRLCEARTVSSARGNWLLELDGVAALDEFRDAAGVLWDDERRALGSVLVALPASEERAPHAAIVRDVVGIDRDAGAIALSEPLAPGTRLAFARRDPVAAREALTEVGEVLGQGTEGPGLGLAVSCASRGEAFFGHEGIESAYLSRAFAPDTWLALVGRYQIGTLACGTAGLLTQSVALAHIR